MKVQIKDFKRVWDHNPKNQGVVLYGHEASAVSLILKHMVESWKTGAGLEVLTVEAKEFLAQPHNLFENLTTQDLFSPQKDYLVHVQGATDKIVSLLEELLTYTHVTLVVEAFGLPPSSTLIRWAGGHAALLAIPLYQDGVGWETLVPFELTADQARTIQSLSQHTHESLEHICQKLQYFIAPESSLTADVFRDFIHMHDVSWQLEGFVGEAIQRPDAHVVGLSRLLFADCYRSIKPNAPQWGKQRAWFEHMSTLSPQAQTRILGHFLTSEAKSMHHTHVPLCAAFKPVIAYHLEYQFATGRLDPSGMKDVVSIRLCS